MISERAPIGRHPWFPSPLRVAAGAVVVVAVVAMAVVLIPRGSVGPALTVRPSPTAVAGLSSAGPTPTFEPSATPSNAPTPAATVEPTATAPVEPTPIPTTRLGAWTGLEWSAPFEPFPITLRAGAAQDVAIAAIADVTAWHGGYVGVGSISHGSQCDEAAFFTSDDGVSWAVAQKASSGDQRISMMCPAFVVRTANGLVAMGEWRVWSSADGVHWTEIDSRSWRALWSSGLPQLMGVASGPGGLVAIGTDPASHRSIVAHSADGRVWQRVDPPASGTPIVYDLATYDGRYVLVGRDGQPDNDPTLNHPAIQPGIGRPAAWLSSDGVTWTAAQVEGSRVQGGGLGRVLVGSDGLFAIGNDTPSDYYPYADYSQGRSLTAWVSAGGTRWTIAGALGTDLPPMGGLTASDGTHMVALGLRQSAAWLGIEDWVEQDPTAWSSTDGSHWTALTVSGKAPAVDFLGLEPELTGNLPDSAVWLSGDRILMLGRGDGVPINQPNANQWFRFGTLR
jgi:hypothetical protein